MTALTRRDHRPELGFFELSCPSGAPPGTSLEPDADGNALTLFAWTRAQIYADLLEAR